MPDGSIAVARPVPCITPAVPQERERVRVVQILPLLRRTLGLVWSHEHRLALTMLALTVATALVPTISAWIGRAVVDTAAAAAAGSVAPAAVIGWVAIEGALMLGFMASQRGSGIAQSILSVRMGHRVQRLVLEHAQRLELSHFEDSEFYDRLGRAQREASTRPLAASGRTFAILRTGIAFAGAAVLLMGLSPWAVALLVLAGLPSLIVEAKFSRAAFRLLNNRTPEARERAYLQTLLTREDYVKETKLGGHAPELLSRYDRLFERVYREDRGLAIARGTWGFLVGAIGSLIFFSLYGYIAWQAALGAITLGEMTMYLLLVRQGQSAVTAGLGSLTGTYDDALYLSNLFGFLDHEPQSRRGTADVGPEPSAGIRFIDVSFRYPGAPRDSLDRVSFHLPPGSSLALVGANGSGKSTLVKLLTGLHLPTRGRIEIDGLDVRQWSERALCRRTAVVLQAFARYQFTAGHNIGLGDVPRCDDEAGWREAAEAGQAAEFIERLPEGYDTRVGTWFPGGTELSGGQWQKLALARAFMRRDAKTIVLDEPTSALDPEAEAQVFEHVRGMGRARSVVLISHRFSTVRGADQILVLDEGRVLEHGDHDSLMRIRGRYASLFERQARAYR